MKKIIPFILCICLAIHAGAQQTITMDELDKHVNDSVTVCTKIFGGIFLDHSKNTPTLLNAGGAYPNNPLTVLIWADTRAQFKEAPELFYKDKDVCISGKIIIYKDKPEIVIYDPKQIALKE